MREGVMGTIVVLASLAVHGAAVHGSGPMSSKIVQGFRYFRC